MRKRKKCLVLLIMHIILAVYSFLGIFSKLAAQEEFLSFRFCMFYGISLIGLFIYAIVWQQLLKRIPLVTAYANKAVTVIWGIIWGFLFFEEPITIIKVVGALIIILGVYLVVSSDYSEEKEAKEND